MEVLTILIWRSLSKIAIYCISDKNLEVDIKFIDERLTSYEAEQVMHKMNIKTGFNKAKIDKIAASIILQEYLQTL